MAFEQDNEAGGGLERPEGGRRFDKIMFWSLLPAIVIIPLWLFAGRELIGGPGGWTAIILMSTVCPILFLYHIAIFISLWIKNARVHESFRDFHIKSRRFSKVVLSYYVVHFLIQVFMNDGGDQGNMGSVAEKVFGIPRGVCDGITAVLMFIVMVVQLVAIAVLTCLEPSTLSGSHLPLATAE